MESTVFCRAICDSCCSLSHRWPWDEPALCNCATPTPIRTNRAVNLPELVEHLHGDVEDVVILLHQKVYRALSCHRLEIAPAQFKAHGRTAHVLTAQAITDPFAELQQFLTDDSNIADVSRKGIFGTHRLDIVIDRHSTVIDTLGMQPQAQAVLAEVQFHLALAELADLADRRDAEPTQAFRSVRADTPHGIDWHRRQIGRFLPGGHDLYRAGRADLLMS